MDYIKLFLRCYAERDHFHGFFQLSEHGIGRQIVMDLILAENEMVEKKKAV